MARGRPKKIKEVANEPYKASVKIAGHVSEAKGDTVAEAIASLVVGRPMGVCILSVFKGDKRQDRVLNSFTTSRLFSKSPLTREIFTKNVSARFDV